MQEIIRQYDPALTESLTSAAAESASKVAALLKRKASKAAELRAKEEPTAADVRLAGLLESEVLAVVDLIQDYKQLLAQREAEAASCWQMIQYQETKARKLWNEVQYWEADAKLNRDHCLQLGERLAQELTEKLTRNAA
jgi:hypothetical protein